MVNDGGRFIGGLFTVSGWMRIPTNFFRGWDLSSLKPEWFNLIVISSMGNELTMITLLAKHQPSRLILNTIGLPPTQWQSQPGFLHFYHPRKVTAWITWQVFVHCSCVWVLSRIKLTETHVSFNRNASCVACTQRLRLARGLSPTEIHGTKPADTKKNQRMPYFLAPIGLFNP